MQGVLAETCVYSSQCAHAAIKTYGKWLAPNVGDSHEGWQQTAGFSNKNNKQTPWPLVRERTIPTDRPPLDEI
jgi:hypothetical protein